MSSVVRTVVTFRSESFNTTEPKPGGRFMLVLGYRPEEPVGDWIGTVERDCGFLASLFGGRSKGISAAAVEAVHQALTGCPEISRIAWHHQSGFDKGNESGAASP